MPRVLDDSGGRVRDRGWAYEAVKTKRERTPHQIEWGWIAFVAVYLLVGIGLMWFIAQLTDGTI